MLRSLCSLKKASMPSSWGKTLSREWVIRAGRLTHLSDRNGPGRGQLSLWGERGSIPPLRREKLLGCWAKDF